MCIRKLYQNFKRKNELVFLMIILPLSAKVYKQCQFFTKGALFRKPCFGSIRDVCFC
ncbi:hypothetical protein AAZX31_15G027500 [Glycine max]